MIKLKKYQESTLATLRQYLDVARFKGAKQAYDDVQFQRYQSKPFKPFQPLTGLEEVPYACLRLPTGGGKTLLSAHTIRLAGEAYIENDYPLTLWLVPTNVIKLQTLETLKNPNNANRRVLEDAFNGRFRVFDIADFRQIRPQDIADAACIVISTFAALRVDNTKGRKVYDHDENLEPHFSKIPAHTDKMERDESSDQIKFSFANLLHWHQPLVIVDEAHNAKSDLSIEVLKRVNASCVIEYTATPAQNSNTIYSVSAAELKAEEMIKLPIILSEHISWEEAITASIQTRQKLEDIAHKDKDYIRPIILFQAENKGREVTVEVLEKHLVENEGIERSEIAIATGTQRELDSINLFDPNCKIRYIITVQALKEGWDCSFAYVLCSVANTKSATAVEQLLGRVLRMPYAKTRKQKELNQAYAYVSSQSWVHAASQLHGHLVNMGFEKQEAEEFIYSQPSFDIENQPLKITLTAAPDLSGLDDIEKKAVVLEEHSAKIFTIEIAGDIDHKFIDKLAKGAGNNKDKIEIQRKGNIHIQSQVKNLSPARRGEVFSIPQLCLNFGDEVELAEIELCLEDVGWNILDYYTPFTEKDFEVNQPVKQYSADLSKAGDRITINLIAELQQLNLGGIKTEVTEQYLTIWLDKKLHADDIRQEYLFEYIRKTVKDLLTLQGINLPRLSQGKFILEKTLKERINKARLAAYNQGFQKCMFSQEAIVSVAPERFSFTFPTDNYPANTFYNGPIRFNKHFYSSVGDMNDEEVKCAEAIDCHPQVKFWVRNLERQPHHAFWLPTATDRFYPDFVALLDDGRIIVIEYKGEHLKSNDDTRAKALIGEVWAIKSGHLFSIVSKKDESGKNVSQQINNLIEK